MVERYTIPSAEDAAAEVARLEREAAIAHPDALAYVTAQLEAARTTYRDVLAVKASAERMDPRDLRQANRQAALAALAAAIAEQEAITVRITRELLPGLREAFEQLAAAARKAIEHGKVASIEARRLGEESKGDRQ